MRKLFLFVLLLGKFLANQSERKIMIKLDKEYKFYRGIIPIGSNQQELAFIFSTASSLSWIPGSECTECKGEKFMEKESQSFSGNSTTYTSYNVRIYLY
jgi:hypothetical protein